MRWVSYTKSVSCMEGDTCLDTIAKQNRCIQDFMGELGWNVDRKYTDRKTASSGTEAFDNLVADGMKREYDGIVVSSVFRCGRDCWKAKEILAQTFYPVGIQFAVAEDRFCSCGKNPEEVDEYFQKKCQEYNSVGVLNALEQLTSDRPAAGFRRYGYTVLEDGKGVEINQEEALVIREIYDLFLGGETPVQIAGQLNADGIIPPVMRNKGERREGPADRKREWKDGMVKNILACPIYTGGGTRKEFGLNVELHAPQIISYEMFEQVQKIIKTPKHFDEQRKAKEAEIRLLRGKICDMDTGDALHCIVPASGDGERVYAPFSVWHEATPELLKKIVPGSAVLDAIKDALENAGKKASHAYRILGTEEKDIYLEKELAPLQILAQMKTEKLDMEYIRRMKIHEEYHAGKISPAEFEKQEDQFWLYFSKCEDEFKDIMDEVKNIRKAFTWNNPWVKEYRDINVPDKLERRHINRWVKMVYVGGPDVITVQLVHEDWMRRLPDEILDGKDRKQDGKKEQEE